MIWGIAGWSLFTVFRCCRRNNIFDDDYTLLDRELMKFYVKLDVLSAGPSVLILKSGLRICSNGAARTNIPILQDYAYFEVKLQNNAGAAWAVGLCTNEVSVICIYYCRLESEFDKYKNETEWVMVERNMKDHRD
ncbi:unnamed protein product [Trichobilharzia regenti]|nr:unnamed protein product [Trichobilharzia regenti]